MAVRWILFRWWLVERKEQIVRGAAWMLPKRVAYWAFIRLAANMPDGDAYPLGPMDRTVGDVLKDYQSWAR